MRNEVNLLLMLDWKIILTGTLCWGNAAQPHEIWGGSGLQKYHSFFQEWKKNRRLSLSIQFKWQYKKICIQRPIRDEKNEKKNNTFHFLLDENRFCSFQIYYTIPFPNFATNWDSCWVRAKMHLMHMYHSDFELLPFLCFQGWVTVSISEH